MRAVRPRSGCANDERGCRQQSGGAAAASATERDHGAPAVLADAAAAAEAGRACGAAGAAAGATSAAERRLCSASSARMATGAPPSAPAVTATRSSACATGDDVSGWKVERVEPRRLVLTQGERSVDFALFDGARKGGKGCKAAGARGSRGRRSQAPAADPAASGERSSIRVIASRFAVGS